MIRLSTADASFTRDFADLVDARRESEADVTRDVSNILRSVRDEGDAADDPLFGCEEDRASNGSGCDRQPHELDRSHQQGAGSAEQEA